MPAAQVAATVGHASARPLHGTRRALIRGWGRLELYSRVALYTRPPVLLCRRGVGREGGAGGCTHGQYCSKELRNDAMIHFRRVALALSAMVLMCLVVASESGAARSSAIGQTAAARVLTRPRRARAKQLTQSRKPRSGRSDVSGRESGALGRAGLPSSSKAARTRAAPVETERVASKGGAEEAPRSLDQSQPANARVGAGSDQGDVNLRRSGRKRGGRVR